MKILSTKRFEELLQEINNLEKEVHLERRAKNKNQALLNDSLNKIKELENYSFKNVDVFVLAKGKIENRIER